MGCEGLSWQDCAILTKKALVKAESPVEALTAYGEWAKRYRQLYEAQAGLPALPKDLDRFESAVLDKIADKIDEYTNPASIALALAIKRYFPMVASILAFASKPVVQGVWTFLVPSPIANDLQQAQLANDEFSQLVMTHLAPVLRAKWQENYDGAIEQALATGVLPKP